MEIIENVAKDKPVRWSDLAKAIDANFTELPKKSEIPDTSSFVKTSDISDMETKAHAAETYQPVGEYALKTELPKVDLFVTSELLGTKLDTATYTADKELLALKSELPDLSLYIKNEAISDMLTKTEATKTYQSIGEYALKTDIPKVNNFITNDLLKTKLDVTTYNLDKELLALKSDLGGLKLKKCTQEEYNSIDPKDPNTLYIITK